MKREFLMFLTGVHQAWSEISKLLCPYARLQDFNPPSNSPPVSCERQYKGRTLHVSVLDLAHLPTVSTVWRAAGRSITGAPRENIKGNAKGAPLAPHKLTILKAPQPRQFPWGEQSELGVLCHSIYPKHSSLLAGFPLFLSPKGSRGQAPRPFHYPSSNPVLGAREGIDAIPSFHFPQFLYSTVAQSPEKLLPPSSPPILLLFFGCKN